MSGAADKIGRLELLRWINDYLQTDYVQLTELGDGVAYVQLFDSILFLNKTISPAGGTAASASATRTPSPPHPSSARLPLHRLSFGGISKLSLRERIQNFSLLSDAFRRLAIGKYNGGAIPIADLAAAKFQANYAFAEWCRRIVLQRNKPQSAAAGHKRSPTANGATASSAVDGGSGGYKPLQRRLAALAYANQLQSGGGGGGGSASIWRRNKSAPAHTPASDAALHALACKLNPSLFPDQLLISLTPTTAAASASAMASSTPAPVSAVRSERKSAARINHSPATSHRAHELQRTQSPSPPDSPLASNTSPQTVVQAQAHPRRTTRTAAAASASDDDRSPPLTPPPDDPHAYTPSSGISSKSLADRRRAPASACASDPNSLPEAQALGPAPASSEIDQLISTLNADLRYRLETQPRLVLERIKSSTAFRDSLWKTLTLIEHACVEWKERQSAPVRAIGNPFVHAIESVLFDTAISPPPQPAATTETGLDVSRSSAVTVKAAAALFAPPILPADDDRPQLQPPLLAASPTPERRHQRVTATHTSDRTMQTREVTVHAFAPNSASTHSNDQTRSLVLSQPKPLMYGAESPVSPVPVRSLPGSRASESIEFPNRFESPLAAIAFTGAATRIVSHSGAEREDAPSRFAPVLLTLPNSAAATSSPTAAPPRTDYDIRFSLSGSNLAHAMTAAPTLNRIDRSPALHTGMDGGAADPLLVSSTFTIPKFFLSGVKSPAPLTHTAAAAAAASNQLSVPVSIPSTTLSLERLEAIREQIRASLSPLKIAGPQHFS